jgi:hypothetical protein
MDAFISHSSKNAATAARLEQALQAQGLDVWLDESELGLGVMLGTELRESMRSAHALVLLWSKPASESRWVCSEWLTALHLDRFIVPWVLDGTPLPQCLQNTVYLKASRMTKAAVDRVARTVRAAPHHTNPLEPVMRAAGPELDATIASLAAGQQSVGERLGEGELDGAKKRQDALDKDMAAALARWPLDPMIVNLAGYHLKNAYLVEHWDAIQAGRGPSKDPNLVASEQRFFETLSIDPRDPSALNGLGSFLTFRRDLDAAEFFITAALAEAKRQGFPYPEAEQDLALVHRYQGD